MFPPEVGQLFSPDHGKNLSFVEVAVTSLTPPTGGCPGKNEKRRKKGSHGDSESGGGKGECGMGNRVMAMFLGGQGGLALVGVLILTPRATGDLFEFPYYQDCYGTRGCRLLAA
jgi:hypothetical protein